MRKIALSSVVLVLLGAGTLAFAASGGGETRALDLARTANASSVHYDVSVTLTKSHEPLTLHIAGASARDKLVAHLALGEQTASILRDPDFVYEGQPSSAVVFGTVQWLRVRIGGMSPNASVFSTLRALSPSPLVHVAAEAKLRPVGRHGAFAGPVRYDDPIVRRALYQLTAGFEFRGMRLYIVVDKSGLLRTFNLTGRTADGKTTLALHARLFGYGTPVRVEPPAPGTFMDPDLVNLES